MTSARDGQNGSTRTHSLRRYSSKSPWIYLQVLRPFSGLSTAQPPRIMTGTGQRRQTSVFCCYRNILFIFPSFFWLISFPTKSQMFRVSKQCSKYLAISTFLFFFSFKRLQTIGIFYVFFFYFGKLCSVLFVKDMDAVAVLSRKIRMHLGISA